jgi:hypothetical protein
VFGDGSEEEWLLPSDEIEVLPGHRDMTAVMPDPGRTSGEAACHTSSTDGNCSPPAWSQP